MSAWKQPPGVTREQFEMRAGPLALKVYRPRKGVELWRWEVRVAGASWTRSEGERETCAAAQLLCEQDAAEWLREALLALGVEP